MSRHAVAKKRWRYSCSLPEHVDAGGGVTLARTALGRGAATVPGAGRLAPRTGAVAQILETQVLETRPTYM